MSTTTSGHVTRTIDANIPGELQTILGVHDSHLKMIVDSIPVQIISRSGKMLITGEPSDVVCATSVIEKLQDRTRLNLTVDKVEVGRALDETLAVKYRQQQHQQTKPVEYSDEKQAVLLEIFDVDDKQEIAVEQFDNRYSIFEDDIAPPSDSAPKEISEISTPNVPAAKDTVPAAKDTVPAAKDTVKENSSSFIPVISHPAISLPAVEDVDLKQKAKQIPKSAEVKNVKWKSAREIVSQTRTSEKLKTESFKTCSPMSRQPRSEGQARYLNAIEQNDLVFCSGPAGSGKTYLAVAMALHHLQKEMVRKIVLVRPAVEAGEKLGYLPGDMLAKVNPFLRPLLDALQDMINHEQVQLYMDHDVIEIVPLAFMRGRTLNDTFMILDEAQNTTVTQMKMFLTRMGTGSKIIVTGDETQNDLPVHVRSGLTDAMQRLKAIEGADTVRLDGRDIVRHRLVRDIVKAYDQQD